MTESLGLLVVHNDPVPEAEIWPEAHDHGVEVVTGRFTLNRPPGQEYLGEDAQQVLTPDVTTTLLHLSDAGVSRIGLCFLSASAFGGQPFDTDITRLVRQQLGVELFTAGQALRWQIEHLGVRKIVILTPPWFTPRTREAIGCYLAPAGVSVLAMQKFKLTDEWSGPEQELFDKGAKNSIDAGELRDQMLQAWTPEADAIVVPGSGFRANKAAKEVSAIINRPVLTANRAVLRWHLLQSPT